MKKTILVLFTSFAFISCGYINSQPTQARAAYTWVKTKTYPDPQPFYYAGKSSAYLWNKSHTAKQHNLKNYPKTTWFVSQSIQIKHHGKTAIYYVVTSGNKRTQGLVLRGYLTKGFNPKIPAIFTQNITNRQKQATKATILKIMNQAHLDPDLQKVADTVNQLNTSDSYEYFKGQLPLAEQNTFMLITSSDSGENNHALNSGKITYHEFLKKNIVSQLTQKGLSLTTIKDYRVGIGIDQGVYILLLPPAI